MLKIWSRVSNGLILSIMDFRMITLKILYATIRELTMENPIELGQDLAPEDNLLECFNIEEFPNLKSEAWKSCTFHPDFPDLDCLKYHRNVLFQPFDQEGLRMDR